MYPSYRLFENMDEMLTRLFLQEIKHQCEFAIISYNDLCNGLRNSDGNRVWLSLQSMLISSANISKIIYPKDKKYDDRGQELRNRLSISGIEKFISKKARNHFEHFDERLNDLFESSKYHNFIDTSIGGDNFISGGENFIDYIRFFNSQRFVFRFRENEYEINPLYNDIIDLYNRVDKELQKFRP